MGINIIQVRKQEGGGNFKMKSYFKCGCYSEKLNGLGNTLTLQCDLHIFNEKERSKLIKKNQKKSL